MKKNAKIFIVFLFLSMVSCTKVPFPYPIFSECEVKEKVKSFELMSCPTCDTQSISLTPIGQIVEGQEVCSTPHFTFIDTIIALQVITLHRLNDQYDSLSNINDLLHVKYFFNKKTYQFNTINELLTNFNHQVPVQEIQFRFNKIPLDSDTIKPRLIKLRFNIHLKDGRVFVFDNTPTFFYL